MSDFNPPTGPKGQTPAPNGPPSAPSAPASAPTGPASARKGPPSAPRADRERRQNAGVARSTHVSGNADSQSRNEGFGPPRGPKAMTQDRGQTNTGSRAPIRRDGGTTNLMRPANRNFRPMTGSTVPNRPGCAPLSNIAENKELQVNVVPLAESGSKPVEAKPTAPAAVPPKPAASSWASSLFKDVSTLLPGEKEIRVSWYTPNVEFISDEEKQLIKTTACKIAKERNCDLVCIRSDIHNTTNARDARTGQKYLVPAPWHYTVEFQNKDTKKWMNAHVFTDTTYVRDEYGIPRRVTAGLRPVDGVVIKSNPETYPEKNDFSHAPNCYAGETVKA